MVNVVISVDEDIVDDLMIWLEQNIFQDGTIPFKEFLTDNSPHLELSKRCYINYNENMIKLEITNEQDG